MRLPWYTDRATGRIFIGLSSAEDTTITSDAERGAIVAHELLHLGSGEGAHTGLVRQLKLDTLPNADKYPDMLTTDAAASDAIQAFLKNNCALPARNNR